MKRTPDPIPLFQPLDSDSWARRTMLLGERDVPEINGSRGAFIGVVVSLSVLILICCIAVFYLLRHHEPTEQERAARRERYRRTREQTLNSSSSSGTLGDKVKQVWQSTTGRGRGRGRRGGRGWIRAGSDDEWASHSDHEGGGDPDPELGGPLRSLPVLRQGDVPGDAESDVRGVRVVDSPSSDTASGFVHGSYGYTYTDPFPKTVSDGALQRTQSPLSSPISSPSVDDHHDPHPLRDDHRHRSTLSAGSVWTHAGSKFVEDI